jgi:antitoxin (DNA-binding transcriptional repressor) of toxin-antitoxin stability system
MKTANVATLRNEFPKVFSWIEAGEEVAILKRGRLIANLTPPKPAVSKKTDWAARLKAHPPLGRGLSRTATEKLWHDLRD